jgi:hypothetical protein
MWQTFLFGMHRMHGGKMYYDELVAETKEEAAEYFNEHKRDDVKLMRVDLIGPDECGLRECAGYAARAISLLKARRRTDKDEDAR